MLFILSFHSQFCPIYLLLILLALCHTLEFSGLKTLHGVPLPVHSGSVMKTPLKSSVYVQSFLLCFFNASNNGYYKV